jgi:ABC-type transport system substrate-binding protein
VPAVPPSSTAIPHAPEIRFGVVGEIRDVNVWALFDESGSSYPDYALRSEYWPRLYALSVPGTELVPVAALGSPAPVGEVSQGYAGTAVLRNDLHWTDGRRLTAADVVFSANTAVRFGLGLDWDRYYPAAVLDHAEAAGADSVVFHFRQPPDVGTWQFGVLQGPIVQQAYWEPRIVEAAALLPSDDLIALMQEVERQRSVLQATVDELGSGLLASRQGGKQDRQLEASLNRSQGDLTAAINRLAELQVQHDDQIQAARQALFALHATGEPTLGPWIPAGRSGAAWLNDANPDYPIAHASFDRASYRTYPDEASAIRALQADEVDMLLSPDGLSVDGAQELSGESGVFLTINPSSRVRFLLINRSRPQLSDPALREALACLVQGANLSGPALAGRAQRQHDFVVGSYWHADRVQATCAELDGADRVVHLNRVLRDAGYRWRREPTLTQPGLGLVRPDGEEVGPFSLLSLETDPSRMEFAAALRLAAKYIGLDLRVQPVESADIDYAVFSSRDFDLAVLGWRLGRYPGYLCQWLGRPGTLDLGNPELASACDLVSGQSNLADAKEEIRKIQALASEDRVLIPVYSEVTTDAFRNLSYPVGPVLDGLSGIYGLPALAIPRR